MNAAIYLFTCLVMLSIAAVAFGAAVAIRAYLRYRGKMLFTCPETGKAVVVKVAAGEAARSSLIGRQSLKRTARGGPSARIAGRSVSDNWGLIQKTAWCGRRSRTGIEAANALTATRRSASCTGTIAGQL